MKEQSSKNSLTPSDLTAEPLFDDEQTILTARPVVPLDQIDKKLKLKSRWFIAGAFVVAMLLGGASGLVSGYLKVKAVPEPRVAEGETQASFEEPLDSTVPVGLGEESNASLLPVPEEQAPKPVISKRVVRPRPVTRSTNDLVVSQPLSEDEELWRIRQAVLLEQWQGQGRRRHPSQR
ncbi:MAG TPA: hypothetical protein VLB68_23585 [Pyrinomonadaceae bacterium]|nr:hypothetical protein [Pyrinomonadaceae bacterium]